MKLSFMKWSPVIALIMVVAAGGCSFQYGQEMPDATVDIAVTEEQEILNTKESSWDGVLLKNGHFSEDVSGWEVPYGSLTHSLETYYSPPGGAIAITNDTGGSVGYRTSFGQCIDIRDFLESLSPDDGQPTLVIEAAIKTDPKITEASIHGIFVDDFRCGTGHVGSFERINLTGDQDWVIVSSSLPVPEKAKSLHVFINGLGVDGSAQLFIDELKLYSHVPE